MLQTRVSIQSGRSCFSICREPQLDAGHPVASQQRWCDESYLPAHLRGLPKRIRARAETRPLVDLVGRLVDAGTPLAWDARNAVRSSDRSACRARGGFGDYVRSLAEDGVASAATADSA